MKDHFKKGDIIECKDADDLVEMMTHLAKFGVITDFTYEKDGKEGYWLEVIRIERS